MDQSDSSGEIEVFFRKEYKENGPGQTRCALQVPQRLDPGHGPDLERAYCLLSTSTVLLD
jgi:hypothetical protein